jgi:hypothetical protein
MALSVMVAARHCHITRPVARPPCLRHGPRQGGGAPTAAHARRTARTCHHHPTAASAAGHICLLSPPQRGGVPAGLQPGDDACFHPFKCGVAPGAPVATLAGGQGYAVTLQQNLNHWNPGWPGIMDVAIAASAAAGDAGNWTTLTSVPDYWPHLQAAQTNFTVPVYVPNEPCIGCVLRVRYLPNKPTEPEVRAAGGGASRVAGGPPTQTAAALHYLHVAAPSRSPSLPQRPVQFWNCADVAVVYTPSPATPPPVIAAFFAPQHPVSESATAVIAGTVDTGSGVPAELAAVPAGLQAVDAVAASVDGVVYTLGRSLVAARNGSAAWLLLATAPSSPGNPVASAPITLPAGDDLPPSQWTALVAVNYGSAADADAAFAAAFGRKRAATGSSSTQLLAGLGLAPVSGGKWAYQARLIDASSGVASSVLAVSAPQDTFVNFMFATVAAPPPQGSATPVFYFLGGDENSLFTLNAAVFTVPVDATVKAPAPMTSATQANAAFTLGSLSLDVDSGALLALSPGLFGNTSWTLVTVDPSTGAVAPVGGGLAPRDGLFASWYGGAVAGGVRGGRLYHLLRHAADGSLAVAAVDVATGALAGAPTLINGANGAFAPISPVLV